MQLRSGATTGGTVPVRTSPRTPPTTPDEDIPDQIVITSPPRQEDDVDVAITALSVPRTPTQSPQVYTAGTYVANFGRSPSEPANFRPSQFSCVPQPDYRSAREPSEPGDTGSIDGKPTTTPLVPNQPAVSSSQNPYNARDAMRTLIFVAPMRPLDVARNMYLDYTTTQSIKLCNKGCEKLPGDPFNREFKLAVSAGSSTLDCSGLCDVF